MNSIDRIQGVVQSAVDRAVSDLVGVCHWPDCSFINLPMAYPDGSDVTVKVLRSGVGLRVTDNGFAFRDAETHGVTRPAFNRLADDLLRESLVARIKQSVFVDADETTLHSAICEVAAVSWRLAHQCVASSENDDLQDPDAEMLAERLVGLFGHSAVSIRPELAGASTNRWRLTALVAFREGSTVFQQVSGSTYSIYRTSSAFNDLADLAAPPKLIAVVDNKASLGPKLGLISRSGYVVETGQPDEVFVRLAA